MAFYDNWPTVSEVFNGTPVSEEGINNPTIKPLIQRTDKLKSVLEDLLDEGTLSGVRIKNLDISGNVGKVMYYGYNPDNGLWEWRLALAGAIDFPLTTEVNKSSYVVGICETNDTLLLVGKSTKLNLTNVFIDDGKTKRQGPYYLSAKTPGALTSTPPEVSVYVGSFFDNDAIINPAVRDNADAHLHYGFTLDSNPAGTICDVMGSKRLVGFLHDADVNDYSNSLPDYPTLCVTGRPIMPYEYLTISISRSGSDYTVHYEYKGHFSDLVEGTKTVGDIYTPFDIGSSGLVIYFYSESGQTAFDTVTTFTVDDLSQACRGWIPSQPWYIPTIAGRKAEWGSPTARYLYNIGFDPKLARYYPPSPLGVSSLVYNGAEMADAARFREASYGITNEEIIWYDDTAIPFGYDDGGAWEPRVVFYMTRRASGSKGVVTSLTSAKNSPIKVLEVGTTAEGTTGDLQLSLNLILDADEGDRKGYLVVKETNEGTLQRGPVVESITPGNGLIITNRAGEPSGKGNLTIGLAEDRTIRGEFGALALENALQGKTGMFTYVTIPARNTGSTKSGFTSSFQIPYAEISQESRYTVRIMATVFGDRNAVGGAVIPITFSYSILPDSLDPAVTNSLTDAINQFTSTRDINIVLPQNYTAFDPIRITTSEEGADTQGVLGNDLPEGALEVLDGYGVGIRFQNGHPSNNYTGNIGFMSLWWELIPWQGGGGAS